MNRYAHGLRRPAGAVAAVATVAGLVLAGCGGSSGSPASSGSSAKSTTSSSATKSSSPGGGSTSVTSATVPFPVGVGDTWTYKTTYGTVVNKMTAVTPVSGGQQVTMSTTSTTLGTTSHNSAYYVIHSDGSISLPFSQFNTGSSSTTVKLISGNIFWPPAAELASGQAYHDTLQIDFSASGVEQKVTAHVTVQGAGTQSVTVPAGTYSATVVNMTMSETVEGIGVSIEVKTWLANGVGPVQSEAITSEDGTSHVVSKQQLVSFKQG
jgi:hypothetical protein